MKKSHYQLAYLVLLLFVFIILPYLAHADPGGPGDPGGGLGGIDPDCPPDQACPIDGALTALIAIGVGYGIKKLRYNKKAESNS